MSMLDSAAGDTAEMCRTKYPFTPCRKNVGEGWAQMGNNRCVKAFFDNKHIYHTDAENACKKFPNGHLVSIHNDVEQNQVICAMYRVSTRDSNYWIGAYLTESGYSFAIVCKWFWTDDTPFAYTCWAGGKPDFYMAREYCVEMIYVGK
ncbi:galactose-specific lectin nattectin-like [Etheostoma cragini]|uniref:galactose-specific lectin nattectin-like n=1 Tax=Etheostoma cragini TaxID=417921 RepID=UPI00155E153E|nr:galactose-specific lectin nattectin-like [Etheostoma cragini]